MVKDGPRRMRPQKWTFQRICVHLSLWRPRRWRILHHEVSFWISRITESFQMLFARIFDFNLRQDCPVCFVAAQVFDRSVFCSSSFWRIFSVANNRYHFLLKFSPKQIKNLGCASRYFRNYWWCRRAYAVHPFVIKSSYYTLYLDESHLSPSPLARITSEREETEVLKVFTSISLHYFSAIPVASMQPVHPFVIKSSYYTLYLDESHLSASPLARITSEREETEC